MLVVGMTVVEFNMRKLLCAIFNYADPRKHEGGLKMFGVIFLYAVNTEIMKVVRLPFYDFSRGLSRKECRPSAILGIILIPNWLSVIIKFCPLEERT